MNDQQGAEVIRQLQRINKNLMGVGCLLLGLFLSVLVLVFIVGKKSDLQW